jgi:hypothetical protein
MPTQQERNEALQIASLVKTAVDSGLPIQPDQKLADQIAQSVGPGYSNKQIALALDVVLALEEHTP